MVDTKFLQALLGTGRRAWYECYTFGNCIRALPPIFPYQCGLTEPRYGSVRIGSKLGHYTEPVKAEHLEQTIGVAFCIVPLREQHSVVQPDEAVRYWCRCPDYVIQRLFASI
jgi:hypothetical protein